MKKLNYEISKKANADIEGILEYAAENFGAAQVVSYSGELKETIQHIADRPALGRNFTVLEGETLYRYNFKAHVVFYYITATGIFIVLVLGSKMDFLRYLKWMIMDDECELCKKYGRYPNAETRAAIKEARSGKNLTYIEDIDAFMASICEE